MHAPDMLYRPIISNSVAWKQAARQPAGLESRTVAVGSIDRLIFYNPGGLPCGSRPVCKLAATRARIPRCVGT